MGFFSDIGSAFRKAGSAINQTAKNTGSWIQNNEKKVEKFVVPAANKVADTAKKEWKQVEKKTSTAAKDVGKFAQEKAKETKDFAQKTGDKISNFTQDEIKKAGNKIKEAEQGAIKFANKAGDDIAKFGKDAVKFGKDFADGLQNSPEPPDSPPDGNPNLIYWILGGVAVVGIVAIKSGLL